MLFKCFNCHTSIESLAGCNSMAGIIFLIFSYCCTPRVHSWVIYIRQRLFAVCQISIWYFGTGKSGKQTHYLFLCSVFIYELFFYLFPFFPHLNHNRTYDICNNSKQQQQHFVSRALPRICFPMPAFLYIL